jgi:hypothetical protein
MFAEGVCQCEWLCVRLGEWLLWCGLCGAQAWPGYGAAPGASAPGAYGAYGRPYALCADPSCARALPRPPARRHVSPPCLLCLYRTAAVLAPASGFMSRCCRGSRCRRCSRGRLPRWLRWRLRRRLRPPRRVLRRGRCQRVVRRPPAGRLCELRCSRTHTPLSPHSPPPRPPVLRRPRPRMPP